MLSCDGSIQKDFMKKISSNYGIITAVLNTYVKVEHMADVQQNILLRAWKSYPTFAGQSKFSTWLHRIAVNTAIDHLRAKRLADKRKTIAIPVYDNTHNEWYALFEKAFKWLTDKEQELLLLYIRTSLSGPKTAKILNMPVSSVYDKLNKIKEKIKE